MSDDFVEEVPGGVPQAEVTFANVQKPGEAAAPLRPC
jgi:hypothetical protein